MGQIQTYTGHRVHIQMVAGQDETMDTTITVAGIIATDGIIAVQMLSAAYAVGEFRENDFTAGAGVINVVGHAVDTTGLFYLIIWEEIT